MRSPLLLALLALAGTPAAQEATAEEWGRRRELLAEGTQPWYEAELQRIEAELEHDNGTARTRAGELARTAARNGAAVVQVVAEELEALAVAVAEGPARVERASTPLPPGTSAALRAHFHLARARRLLLADHPSEVLADALAAFTAGREDGDTGRYLRAAWFLHDITEDEALELDETLLAEIEQRSRVPDARAFDSIRRMTEYWRTWASLSLDGREAHLAETGRLAAAIGDVRGVVQVEWDSAVAALERGDLPAAVARLERARELAAAAEFRREEAVTLQILADFALQQGELELARSSLAESAGLVAEAGLFDAEIRQAHLALRLASASGAADEVVARTEELEALRTSSDERRRQYAAVRQQLFAAETQRLAMERGMRETKARTRRLIAGAAAVSLLLIALLASFGRRRLAHTNRRLREEMQRAEAETRARTELEQRMRLLERAESLGLIASGVAHDFNNLLAGVLGNAELLRSRARGPETREQLDAIFDSVERGTRLCRQLQTYAGGEPVAFETVELGALLARLEPALRAASGTGREFVSEPLPGPLTTEADRSQLEQALLNLVANARDARARRIRVRARRERRSTADWAREFHRGEARAGEYLVLEVEDDGEGLGPELLERIFDPFFTTRFPGRGLGLAVVLGAVRRHHGVISVASRPGAGATFRLYLPVLARGAPREVVIPHAPARTSSDAKRMLEVLVVDDEAQVCDFVRAILESRGHRVLATQDGTQAARLLAELAPARRVALIDLSMPLVDGRDVVRALRGSAAPPPIVLMSGHSAAHLAETARELEVERHISKPFLSDEIEAVLTQAFEAGRHRASPLAVE